MQEDPAESLRRRYRLALSLAAVLVVLNQALVQPSLLLVTTDAPVINIAGRQRMLSQRLAKAALALNTDDGAARGQRLAELDEVLKLWVVSHEGLRRGNPALSLPGRNSSAVEEAFDGLEPYFKRMCDAADRLIRSSPGARPDDPELRAIPRAEPDAQARRPLAGRTATALDRPRIGVGRRPRATLIHAGTTGSPTDPGTAPLSSYRQRMIINETTQG